MPILGGSPLGLIGVKSGPTNDGMSTFNGGKSRNINVILYNSGREGDKVKLKRGGLDTKQGAFSVFTGGTAIKPWPNIKTGNESNANLGTDDNYSGVSRKTLHNNDIYDTSILNIVEKTANSAASLRPSDFAYLKYLGVYPNNRLIVCRRFASPRGDNVFGMPKVSPIVVLVSWRAPGEDFLDISFGEEWMAADADFTNIVNGIGADILKLSPLGNAAGEMFNAIPLPGWSETLQRMVLEKLGVYEEGASSKRLPAGNPNLIKEAKRRKTIGQGEAGSGLSCKVSIKVTVEYEQKFISGIDPTIVYMDIIQNAIRFGTSPSDDYGLSGTFGQLIIDSAKNPKLIINKVLESLKSALGEVKETVMKFLDEFVSDAESSSKDSGKEDPKPPKKDPADAKKEKKKAAEELDIANKFKNGFNSFFADITDVNTKIGGSLAKTVNKYEESIKGVVSALTGLPSTPWHVTIGNPLRPIFCSGDMYPQSVNLTLGSTLAFNDLPANIKIDFTLENARAWGLQEILGKFNTGNIRVVNPVKDSTMLGPSDSIQTGSYLYSTQSGTPDTSNNLTNTPGGSTPNGDAPISTNSPVSKDGVDQKTINSNPNSSDPAVQNNSTNTTVASLVGTPTYLDLSNGGVQVTATYLINNDKEIVGVGIAQSNGSTKDVQKQSALELAKDDAVKKYK